MYIHCPIGKTVKLLFLCLQVRDDGVIFILTGNIRQTVFPEIMSTTGEDENDETDYLGA